MTQPADSLRSPGEPQAPTAESVVALIRSIRPDWSPAAIATAWHATADRPWDRRVVAAVRCYADPATHSPGRLREAGPWWHEPGDATPVPPNLRRDPVCREHMKRLPCVGCAADAKAARDELEGAAP
jgi:hypothetical protein